MKLRPLNHADALACYALFHRAVHEGAADHYLPAQRAAWAPLAPRDTAKWTERVTAGFARVAVRKPLFRREQILGFFVMGHDGHIDFAYVQPEQRGKGVAAALYDACITEAKRLKLEVLSTEASHLARSFFEKRGWETEAAQTVIRDGVGIENFRMVKQLT